MPYTGKDENYEYKCKATNQPNQISIWQTIKTNANTDNHDWRQPNISGNVIIDDIEDINWDMVHTFNE